MKFLPFILICSAFLNVNCSGRREENAVLLDSLLYITNEEELVKAYGAEHVHVMPNLHGDGRGSFALLFPGTSAQVLFVWNHKVNNQTEKGLRSVKISLEHSVKSPPARARKWTTKAGIIPGMKLKDLEALIGEFKVTVNKVNRKKITTVYKHESDSTTYTIFFDPELKFTRKMVKLANSYSSKLSEMQEEDPVLYAVVLSKEFKLPASVPATSNEENGNVGDSTRIEQVVPFAVFYKKFIASGKLKPVPLPYDQSRNDEGLKTNQSPEGAFQNNVKDSNSNVQLIGLLPDTSRYYGIVWRIHSGYLLDGLYTTSITTFDKHGKVIASERTLPEMMEHHPSSCSIKTKTTGSIKADLSFYSTQLLSLTQCTDSDVDSAYHEITSVTGNVNANGTITVTKSDRHWTK